MKWFSNTLHTEDGVAFTSSTGLVVVDLFPYVGNFLEGFQRMTEKVNTPAVYIPVYTDMEHKDWSDAFWTSEFMSLFQNGKLTVAGSERWGPDQKHHNIMLQ